MVNFEVLISLFCVLLGAIHYLPLASAEDCNEAQSNKHILHNCCNGPVYSLELYKDVCAEYMPEGIPKVSPCLHECVYNASNILIGDQMNLDNVEVMLEKLLSKDSVFHEVSINAFRECSKNIDEMKKLLKRRPSPNPGMEQCSALPLMMSICCQRYMTSHCPESKWKATEKCEKARQCEITMNNRG
ncbi:uncharacterized protein LOC26529210 [Drosophila willistoni]|uniref:uncharacterized protein LOC26529210 n=1 Tax=Drosophila willistoni TaxID=7260 RepID=UPI001F08267C|nr:uncharacterized protein LOC26529210 [Drosophila willistoni]